MLIPALGLAIGMGFLLFSADRFVLGAASTAKHLGLPALLVGMLVIGFGTSAPEATVSAIAALQDNSALALGNAYGSNIANIGLILGLSALVSPIAVSSTVLRKELPLLLAATLLAVIQLQNKSLTRLEAWTLLLLFFLLIVWMLYQGLRKKHDTLAGDINQELAARQMPLARSVFWLILGLFLLVTSSRLLVWSAVQIAQGLGASDLLIGLSILALGTSLPELASSLLAIKRKEPDLALGNVLGSNLFNTLLVVGLSGAIQPVDSVTELFYRDIPVMVLFTGSLFFLGYGFRSAGRINRLEGALLLSCYLGYILFLYITA